MTHRIVPSFILSLIFQVLVLVPAVTGGAALLTYHVDVNTAPLIGDAAGPFAFDFLLNDGSGTLAVPNTVTISDFSFGGGNSLGDPSLFGGATGSLTSSIQLTDDVKFTNELFQSFTPGNTFSFDVSMTTNVDPGPAPDAFAFAILDKNSVNLPTTGLGDSLLLVNINSATLGVGDVQTFATTSPAGVTVTASAVPEPPATVLVGAGVLAFGFCTVLRRRKSLTGSA
jgi:hypothetical protein